MWNFWSSKAITTLMVGQTHIPSGCPGSVVWYTICERELNQHLAAQPQWYGILYVRENLTNHLAAQAQWYGILYVRENLTNHLAAQAQWYGILYVRENLTNHLAAQPQWYGILYVLVKFSLTYSIPSGCPQLVK